MCNVYLKIWSLYVSKILSDSIACIYVYFTRIYKGKYTQGSRVLLGSRILVDFTRIRMELEKCGWLWKRVKDARKRVCWQKEEGGGGKWKRNDARKKEKGKSVSRSICRRAWSSISYNTSFHPFSRPLYIHIHPLSDHPLGHQKMKFRNLKKNKNLFFL